MAQFSDGEFLKNHRRDPERAFRQLMDGFRDRVHLFCHRATADPAEAQDLTQEVFIRVWKGLDRFRGESSLSTWIYRIAWNVCASHLEKRGRATDITQYQEAGENGNAPRPEFSRDDPGYRQYEDRQFLEVLFQALPAAQKLVLTLYYLQEQSYDEIAAVTGWPMGTVKATLHRARSRLREAARQELEPRTV